MSRRLATAVVLLTALAAPLMAQTRRPEPPSPPTTLDLDAVDRYLVETVKTQGFVGLSVAVARDGRLVFAKGYGRKSAGAPAPVGTGTAFAIGSVTKQFACAAALLLAEDGRLSVDDPVAKYEPKATRAADVTLYDLMTHASGYLDYYPLDFVDRALAKPIDPDALLADYARRPLDFEPGTRWSYSNTGYLLLGRALERVSGEPFGDLVAERIFRPLGMSRSGFGPESVGDDRARGHTVFALGDPEPAPPEGEGWLHAAGGLWSTPSDLVAWDLALVSGRVLKPASFARMTAPRELPGGAKKDYGCGLSLERVEGEAVLSHGGSVSGFQTINAVVPRTRSAVALVTNVEQKNPGPVHAALLGLVVRAGKAGGPAAPLVDGPPPEEAARAFLRQLQAGKVDRSALGEEFNAFLTDDRVRQASGRLGPLGLPNAVTAGVPYERGGMQVVPVTAAFKGETLRGLLYRTPDGKIQQLLFGR